MTVLKCLQCNNYLGGEAVPLTMKCKAFPDGIPEIKLAYISRDPCINCNNGIGFEKQEDE